MDFMRGRTATHERKTSVHQGDNFFSGRVISRNSSAGCSSRIFYNRSAEGVPFKWEMQPGTPRDPPERKLFRHLAPQTKTSSMRSRFRFWKLIEKNKRKKKSQQGSEGNSFINIDNNESCTSERFEFYSSDGDFMASPPRNSSSSSSLSSSINGHSRRLSRIENPSRGSKQDPHGCFPWIFNAVLASVARRNI
ncbi:OSBP(oxysterol binding protein)-related protein [Salix suchowensis]|nr:OSBP(oxysterol binding protein)-related protein [Salix suchowensis]